MVHYLEEYTTMENCTLLKDIKKILYHTHPYFCRTLPTWFKTLNTTIGQCPTLYDFLAITREEISHWKYYYVYPNKCVKPNIFQPTLLPPLYSGEMSHHMHDSGESLDVSVCHTISNMTSPSICQSHDSSVCQPKHDSTWNSIHLSVCLSSVLWIQPSAKFTVKIPMSIAV